MNPEEQTQPNNSPSQKPNIEPHSDGDDLFIRPLRTYEDDVKGAVQDNGVSTAKILMAEQQRRQRATDEENQSSAVEKSNSLKIFFTFTLIILGVGAIGYVLYYVKPFGGENISPTVVLTPNDFIEREEMITISTQNKTNRQVIGLVRDEIRNSESMRNQTIKEIQIVKNIEVTVDEKTYFEDVEISSQEFLDLLEARTPDPLLRSLNKKFLLGIHKRPNGAEPFIIFRVDDYELAYANMFGWESFLIADIKDIFFKTLGSSQAFFNEELINRPLDTTQNPDNSSTSSTSTVIATTSTPSVPVITQPYTYNPQNFQDLVLSNRDTRSIVSGDGILLYYYSFINREYLVMATSLETLNIIINRINSAQLVR